MTGSRPRGRPRHPDILTPAEWRVAKAARYGMTNRQIALRLGVSLEAVKYHLASILPKLGMTGRRDLLEWTGMPAGAAEKAMSEMPVAETNPGLPIPPGFTRLFPYLLVEDARAYLDFLAEGLGGLLVDVHAARDGRVLNAHVRFGDTTVMVSEAGGDWPASCGTYYLYVLDAEIAMARAVGAGGKEVMPVGFRPYGERQGGMRDPAGNIWWLSQRLQPGGY